MIRLFLIGMLFGVMITAAFTYAFAIPANSDYWRMEIWKRGGAAWIYDKGGWTGHNDPTWLGIGFAAADFSALLFIIALVTGAIGLRRMRRGRGGEGLLRTSGIIALILLAIYVVAVWAMAGKPA